MSSSSYLLSCSCLQARSKKQEVKQKGGSRNKTSQEARGIGRKQKQTASQVKKPGYQVLNQHTSQREHQCSLGSGWALLPIRFLFQFRGYMGELEDQLTPGSHSNANEWAEGSGLLEASGYSWSARVTSYRLGCGHAHQAEAPVLRL